jgi:protein TonB
VSGARATGPPSSQQAAPPHRSLPPAVDTQAILADYAAQVKAAIIGAKAYPAAAERAGHEGVAKVSFSLDASGALATAALRSSSGFAELDDAALDAVRHAAPFAPLPAELNRDSLSLSITLQFRLE